MAGAAATAPPCLADREAGFNAAGAAAVALRGRGAVLRDAIAAGDLAMLAAAEDAPSITTIPASEGRFSARAETRASSSRGPGWPAGVPPPMVLTRRREAAVPRLS
ncbi:MAG: hypothetical protein ACFBWO_14430 [Paracoccaceae bacterium]